VTGIHRRTHQVDNAEEHPPGIEVSVLPPAPQPLAGPLSTSNKTVSVRASDPGLFDFVRLSNRAATHSHSASKTRMQQHVSEARHLGKIEVRASNPCPTGGNTHAAGCQDCRSTRTIRIFSLPHATRSASITRGPRKPQRTFFPSSQQKNRTRRSPVQSPAFTAAAPHCM